MDTTPRSAGGNQMKPGKRFFVQHGKSYQIVGGGNGGFHYDEFLGFVGYVKKYVVHSYQEDSRQ